MGGSLLEVFIHLEVSINGLFSGWVGVSFFKVFFHKRSLLKGRLVDGWVSVKGFSSTIRSFVQVLMGT
jgi:hypothetical protein